MALKVLGSWCYSEFEFQAAALGLMEVSPACCLWITIVGCCFKLFISLINFIQSYNWCFAVWLKNGGAIWIPVAAKDTARLLF